MTPVLAHCGLVAGQTTPGPECNELDVTVNSVKTSQKLAQPRELSLITNSNISPPGASPALSTSSPSLSS